MFSMLAREDAGRIGAAPLAVVMVAMVALSVAAAKPAPARLAAKPGPAPTRQAPVAAADVPLGRAIQNARLLAADLKTAGVDTAAFEKEAADIEVADMAGGTDAAAQAARLAQAVRKLALSNPLLDFDELLLIRRDGRNLALPANWQSNSSLKPIGHNNDLACIGVRGAGLGAAAAGAGKIRTLYRPDKDRFLGDVDLHFDADRLLASMPDANNQWQMFEMKLGRDANGAAAVRDARALPLIPDSDVANYDACYLPDGNVVFTSTAPFIGVPCVCGSSHVTNMYLWQGAAGNIRRLTFDQDHNWSPAVLNNGRVLYLRWEYGDIPHSNSRRLFSCNPDGTGQMEYYGSNSYWPNGVFYARAIPGHATKVVGIVTGHHGAARMGEMVVFDPGVGTQEADGAVHRFPQRGRKIEPVIADQLVNASWPKFLHPYPLSEKYFLAAAQPHGGAAWGIYLVDVFDNMVLLAEQPGMALLEPLPLRKTPRPPVIAGRVDAKRKDATVYLADVYQGGGLRGVPRGAVKKLRLFAYHFSYRAMGGLLGVVGADGPWDCKRVLGTVPVAEDGSAYFRVPANTPISIQPLGEDGGALQVMRSWFVGMPGENVSCTGCHERQRDAAAVQPAGLAVRRQAAEIEPWRGPVRGFAFHREVQPVIDRNCVGCHEPKAAGFDAARMPDLRNEPLQGWSSRYASSRNGNHSIAYNELARYVRRPGIESDIHMLMPMEFNASTTELVQMLGKGHHGVKLDAEAWDRLLTWIDLNAPYHGTWGEAFGKPGPGPQSNRRADLLKRYANVEEDPETIPPAPARTAPVMPKPETPVPSGAPVAAGWTFGADEAKRRQAALGVYEETIDLGDGVKLQLVRIPAGEFVAGSPDPAAPGDERPRAAKIDKPFWMAKCEVTNQQYARFDALHDSHVEPKHGYQFGVHGYPADKPSQPVVRVSWQRAAAFCGWLSGRPAAAGLTFSLPTETQWEWACRAGSDQPFSYGGHDVDFSKLANLGDLKLKEFATNPYTEDQPMANPNRFDDWVPKDTRFNDGALVAAAVASYQPNAWGLHDMHGNVAEWTLGDNCRLPIANWRTLTARPVPRVYD